MLKEEQLELMADRVYERVKAVNTAYLERIGERYKQLGEISPTDVNRLTRILQWRTSDVSELQALLAKAMNENIKDVENILEGIAKDNYNFAEPFYEAKGVEYVAYAQNAMLVDYANEIIKQTQGTLTNISKTTAIQSSYIEAIDKAVTASTLGLESYSSSIRSAIREVADAGINQVEYDKNGKGYKRRVDTSVRQNVLSAMKQVNLGSSERIGKQFGNDGWEISYHSNPRPSHRDMGGMRYNLYQFEKKGIGDLLNDYNCLHYKYPVVMGVSQSAYDKKELTELKQKDILKVEYNGKQYDRYEMSQIQRRLETAIRKEKDAAVLASKADNMILRREAQTTINRLTAQYEEVSKVAGLPTKVERMTVAGFRPVKGKAVKVEIPKPKPKIELKNTYYKDFNTSDFSVYAKWRKDYYALNADKVDEAGKKAIFDYSYKGDKGVNAVERFEKNSKEYLKAGLTSRSYNKWKKRSDELSEVLSKFELDRDITVYRVVTNIDYITGAGSDLKSIENVIGKTYVEKGFSSTSVLLKGTKDFGEATPIRLEIKVPKGARGAYIDEYSKFRGKEYEFLLDRNTKFKIIDGKEGFLTLEVQND